MNTDNESKLREALEALVIKIGIAPVYKDDNVVGYAREVLRETAPKHPAEVGAQEFCDGMASDYRSNAERAYLAGYKAGMLNASAMLAPDGDHRERSSCKCGTCVDSRAITRAAAEIPLA